MSVDRELLWKAYPDGFLAARGVSTVGGYLIGRCLESGRWCVYGGDLGSGVNLLNPRYALDYRENKFAEPGDLLPDLDPADDATWVCALRDLHRALLAKLQTEGIDHSDRGFVTGLQFYQLAGSKRQWVLRYEQAVLGTVDHVFVLGETPTDTSIALAMARAQLRENGA